MAAHAQPHSFRGPLSCTSSTKAALHNVRDELDNVQPPSGKCSKQIGQPNLDADRGEVGEIAQHILQMIQS